MASRLFARKSLDLVLNPATRTMVTRAKSTFPKLVSSEQLHSHLNKSSGSSSTVILDGSWHMPATKRDPIKEFSEIGHLPGARYFDIESIKDKTNPLPHMMPIPQQFAKQVGELGIGKQDQVVVYDTVGFFSAPRVYWMFKAFGHENVSVLDGGFKAWTQKGYEIEKGEAKIEPKEYPVPKLDASMIRDYDQILNLVKDPNNKVTIVDARGAPRFTGSAPEPRAGLSSGHMPGAKNVPFNELFDGTTGVLLSDDLLAARFEKAGVNVKALQQNKGSKGPESQVVLSCGSGVSAAVLYFALERLGLEHLAVYDGSWSEYAGRPESIIVKD